MGGLSRRRLLAAGAVAAGAAVVGVPAPAVAAAAPRRTPRAAFGDLRDIKHVVILMQENRSFDHYFGALRGVRGFSDRSTITLPGGYSVFQQPTSAPGAPITGTQFPWHLTDTPASAYPEEHQPPSPSVGAQGAIGTPHSWADQHSAWQGGWMNGWVAAKVRLSTLGYLTGDDLPFQYALADAYTVGDAYHCSALSATGPNRTYLWSGTIDAQKKYGSYTAYDGGDERGRNLLWQTYAESLQQVGVSWRVYQCVDHFHDNALEYFGTFSAMDPTQHGTAQPGNALYDQGLATVAEPLTGPSANADNLAAAIKSDVVNGLLPQVSWVVTNQPFSEHPTGAPNDGAYFVRGVLQALNADPDVFNSTLVILTYDENDGQFDHVPPPVAPRGEADEWFRGVPVGLGFRVPLILISPWTRGGWVTSEVCDHTSIIQFLERWTGANGRAAICPNISDWRRRVCGDLTRAFDFTSPTYGMPDLPPVTTVIGDPPNGGYEPAPTTNAMPGQEPGIRSARPLPYQPNVNLDALTMDEDGTLRAHLSMSNNAPHAAKSSHFAVYNNIAVNPSLTDYPTYAPSQHTIDPVRNSATKVVRAVVDLGAAEPPGSYDITVIGPNRFLRRFTGNVLANGRTCEVDVAYYPRGFRYSPVLALNLDNRSHHAVTFTIGRNAYAAGSRAVSVRVPARSRRTHTIDAVSKSVGWYDTVIKVSGDHSWSRRLVGHLETGGPSITGS